MTPPAISARPPSLLPLQQPSFPSFSAPDLKPQRRIPVPKIEPQLGIIPSPTSGREERMSFSLRSIPSVILFLPFWSFQSPRQNCRGLSPGGSSLSGALSEKGGGQPGSQKPLPSHRPSLPSLPWWHPWGSGRLGGYHIFTWMNCTLQLLLCTRNPKVLTLKIVFSF